MKNSDEICPVSLIAFLELSATSYAVRGHGR